MFDKKFEKDKELNFPITFDQAMEIYKEIVCGRPKFNSYYFNAKNLEKGIFLTTNFHPEENKYEFLDIRTIEKDQDKFSNPLNDSYWKEICDIEIDYMTAWKEGTGYIFQNNREIKICKNDHKTVVSCASNSKRELGQMFNKLESMLSK